MLCDLYVTFCQLVLSADNLCKQLRPRSGPFFLYKWFDTLMVFQKDFFSKKLILKKLADDKNRQNNQVPSYPTNLK